MEYCRLRFLLLRAGRLAYLWEAVDLVLLREFGGPGLGWD